MAKLEAGTLHVVYCNGNHKERVGKAGMICNCTLGKEIKELRARAEAAEAQIAEIRTRCGISTANIAAVVSDYQQEIVRLRAKLASK